MHLFPEGGVDWNVPYWAVLGHRFLSNAQFLHDALTNPPVSWSALSPAAKDLEGRVGSVLNMRKQFVMR